MFDLSLAGINHAERERDLAADLRDRQVLKAAAIQTAETTATADATATVPTRDRAPIERPATRRPAAGVRAVGR